MNERFYYLFDRYFKKEATSEEREELNKLIDEQEDAKELLELINKYWHTFDGSGSDVVSEDRKQEILQLVLSSTDQRQFHIPVHRVPFFRKWGWAAAMIACAVGLGTYWWNSSKHNIVHQELVHSNYDVPPGREGAILMLSDGKQIVLDSLGNGVVAKQNGVNVLLENGHLAYDRTRESTGNLAYNTITTPKGRQFQIQLPDGTKVWLNAASSLRYPTVFADHERKVELIGEAYFEVTKNAKVPFLVNINNHNEVRVLGTSFNIQAYDNEPAIQTTLITGSIRLNALKHIPSTKLQASLSGIILKPGQQAECVKDKIEVVNDVDMEKTMAWKSGAFNFEGLRLEEVMRQLTRWYDVEVVYEKGIPDIKFFGKMSRGVSLSGVLKALEGAGLQFRLESGNKLVVMP